MRNLKADLAICEKATPGPWEALTEYMTELGYEQYVKRQEICIDTDVCYHVIAQMNWCNPVTENAVFIAEARQGWPEAIQRAIKAEETLAWIEQQIKQNHMPDEMTILEKVIIKIIWTTLHGEEATHAKD